MAVQKAFPFRDREYPNTLQCALPTHFLLKRKQELFPRESQAKRIGALVRKSEATAFSSWELQPGEERDLIFSTLLRHKKESEIFQKQASLSRMVHLSSCSGSGLYSDCFPSPPLGSGGDPTGDAIYAHHSVVMLVSLGYETPSPRLCAVFDCQLCLSGSALGSPTNLRTLLLTGLARVTRMPRV